MSEQDRVPLEGTVKETSPWLELARRAYDSSTSYLDTNYRRQWERNISLFRSQHPAGSKYNTQSYQHRSRLFRPKTRAAIRTNEAAAAAAFFSTQDVIDVRPENDADPTQRDSAWVLKHLLQYRLTKTIPWFQTVIAAYQEALIFGIVCSHQYWEYQEKKVTHSEPVIDANGEPVLNEDGTPAVNKSEEVEVIKDHPVVRLIASENLRIDSASDWWNPVNSSPYVIEVIPMYLQDAMERMKEIDAKTGDPKWKTLSKEQLVETTSKTEFDSTRQTRSGNRMDPRADKKSISEFTTVFVHKNIIRKNGKDWLFYTAGTQYLLTDPKPLTDVYPHLKNGERPYTMGCAILEAHKTFPTSLVEMSQDLQTAVNDLANQRSDNVSLVLNKRYHIRRSANIDIHALKRSVPGGSVMMDDPTRDVQVVNTPDVTQSSYQEQDRLNVDFDEISGNFSQSTVQTNRSLNETVGGMEMLSAGANQQMEYMLRTFSETWVEPVLRQLVRLEQYYETDTVVMNVAVNAAAQEQEETEGESAIYTRFGEDADTDDLLRNEMTVSVNVGIGATDPVKKIDRLLLGIRTMAEIDPNIIAIMDQKEISKEVFGALGYKDSQRFFSEEQKPMLEELAARLEQMEQVVQQLADQGQAKQIDAQAKIAVAQIKAASDMKNTETRSMTEAVIAKQKMDSAEDVARLRQQLDVINARIKAEKNDIARGELLLQKEALVHQMIMAEPKIGIDEEGKMMSEVLMNDEYGMVPGAEH